MMFSKPAEIVAEYKVVTPLFLGGASQEADDKVFRAASLKGALRFWWRALNWSATLSEANNDTFSALKNLHKKEGDLFGTASDGGESRQSRFQLLADIKNTRHVSAGGKSELSYLLGLGLYSYRSGITRAYLSGGEVSVKIRFKPNTPAEDVETVYNALIAFGLFGGLGSRARKGFGSLAIQQIQKDGVKQKFERLSDVEAFINVLNLSAPISPPFSAFSQGSRIDASVFGRSASTVHRAINDEQQLYRSYGKDGMVNNQPARRNFKDDHDNVYAAINDATPLKTLPKRSVFGLPHNYHFSSGGDMEIAPDKKGRRASPLLIHIHEFPDGQCVAFQTLLQSLFLHKDMTVKAENPKNRRNSQQDIADQQVDYQVIHRYLDGFSKVDKNSKVLRHGQ